MRRFIFAAVAALTAACGSAATTAEPAPATAPPPAATALRSARAPFVLAPLPYAPDALAPVIDAETMTIHHGRHHNAYVNNLNAAITQTPELAGKSLEEMLGTVSTLSKAVRDNGGGHYNHALFWSVMAPAGTGGAPSEALAARITEDFGSFDAFKSAFIAAGLSQFGSGWAWLVWSDGALKITATPNQDNPLMDVAAVRGEPILAIDVWEHAYYLQYQNRRGDYLNAWWDVVNWNEVNRLYAAASQPNEAAAATTP